MILYNYQQLCSILSIPFTTCALRFVQHQASAATAWRTQKPCDRLHESSHFAVLSFWKVVGCTQCSRKDAGLWSFQTKVV
jgi:hypothetical protein